MKLEAHAVVDSDLYVGSDKDHRDSKKAYKDLPLALVHPASDESVVTVLTADKNSADGRSNWVWVRLPNNDLILGVYPQGDIYLAVEDDARYPYENSKQH